MPEEADGPGVGGGIALVGYRGAGKSTVARIVADRLGMPFVDLDHAIEARAGASIAAIFETQGESAFRDLEERILAEFVGTPRLVVATGGGVVVRESNRRMLRRFRLVAWLETDPSALVERLVREPGDRPSLTGRGLLEEVEEVLASRTPLYHEVADAVIPTSGRTPEEVAIAVIRAFEASSRSPSP